MIDPSEFDIETLLFESADLPEVPRGMRTRVVAAATQAARRRLRMRRIATAMISFLALGLGTMWLQPSTQPASSSTAGQSADTELASPAQHPFARPAQIVAMSDIGEWGLVDCIVRLRVGQSQLLRGVH